MALQEWEGIASISCLNNLSDWLYTAVFLLVGFMILSSRSCSKAAAHPPVWTGQMETVILSYCVWNLSWFWSSGVTFKFNGIVHGQLQTQAKELLCAEWLLSASVSPGLLPTWVSLQQLGNVPQLHSPAWLFALCYGNKWFSRMFPLSLPSAALAIAAKLSLSFVPFWDDLGVPYPKEPWHKQYCNCMQWSSPEWSQGIPLPSPAGLQPSCSAKAAGKNIAVIRDKVGLTKLIFLPY